LQHEDKIIEGDTKLKKHITTYYKEFFGLPKPSSFSLDESRVDNIVQVSQKEYDRLVQLFIEDEVRGAIFQMEHNKAPDPDEFPAEFYQSCLNIIKEDLMALFKEFHQSDLPLFSLNFGMITLLPKCRETTKNQQYKPICLLNVSVKIFTKVSTNRVTKIAQKTISPSQTAFLLGRNIMEGVIVLHETIHEMHRKKQNSTIFKIDFEKVYGNVSWSFVQQILRMKGFSPMWRRLVASFMEGGHVGTKINNIVGQNF
jgi:hypothetical protein